MKTFTSAVTVASVVLNLGLIGLLFAGRNTPPPAAPAISNAFVRNSAPDKPVIHENVWPGLNPDDLPAMVQQLRESGFPREIVRAIAAAMLRESFAARRKALDPGAENRPFWKTTTIDPRLNLAMRKLYREEQAALRALLGPDADDVDGMQSVFQGRRLETIPAEKVDEVKHTLREFDEARMDIYGDPGTSNAERSKKFAELEKSRREALAGILTAQELEDYELRNSDTARQVRSWLSAFHPTEEEFRAIYKAQADFDARFGRLYSAPDRDEMRLRSEAQKQMKEQIKATLGPVRGAEYERAIDFHFRHTDQLVTRLELPPETTDQVWAVKKEIEDRSSTLRRDKTLAPEDRKKQLAALAQEASEKIAPLLGGPRGFEAYKQYGGLWMQTLTPRPQTRSTPARKVN